MSEFTQGILIALIPALIVSVITAYLTVRLSMRQFYSQRWWEKKAEAYSNIVEHLSYLQICIQKWLDHWTNVKELREKDKKELIDKYNRARESVQKAAVIGAYIVSADTAAAISRFLVDLEFVGPTSDPVEKIENSLSLTRECIAKIKEHAKADLRIS